MAGESSKSVAQAPVPAKPEQALRDKLQLCLSGRTTISNLLADLNSIIDHRPALLRSRQTMEKMCKRLVSAIINPYLAGDKDVGTPAAQAALQLLVRVLDNPETQAGVDISAGRTVIQALCELLIGKKTEVHGSTQEALQVWMRWKSFDQMEVLASMTAVLDDHAGQATSIRILDAMAPLVEGLTEEDWRARAVPQLAGAIPSVLQQLCTAARRAFKASKCKSHHVMALIDESMGKAVKAGKDKFEPKSRKEAKAVLAASVRAVNVKKQQMKTKESKTETTAKQPGGQGASSSRGVVLQEEVPQSAQAPAIASVAVTSAPAAARLPSDPTTDMLVAEITAVFQQSEDRMAKYDDMSDAAKAVGQVLHRLSKQCDLGQMERQKLLRLAVMVPEYMSVVKGQTVVKMSQAEKRLKDPAEVPWVGSISPFAVKVAEAIFKQIQEHAKELEGLLHSTFFTTSSYDAVAIRSHTNMIHLLATRLLIVGGCSLLNWLDALPCCVMMTAAAMDLIGRRMTQDIPKALEDKVYMLRSGVMDMRQKECKDVLVVLQEAADIFGTDLSMRLLQELSKQSPAAGVLAHFSWMQQPEWMVIEGAELKVYTAAGVEKIVGSLRKMSAAELWDLQEVLVDRDQLRLVSGVLSQYKLNLSAVDVRPDMPLEARAVAGSTRFLLKRDPLRNMLTMVQLMVGSLRPGNPALWSAVTDCLLAVRLMSVSLDSGAGLLDEGSLGVWESKTDELNMLLLDRGLHLPEKEYDKLMAALAPPEQEAQQLEGSAMVHLKGPSGLATPAVPAQVAPKLWEVEWWETERDVGEPANFALMREEMLVTARLLADGEEVEAVQAAAELAVMIQEERGTKRARTAD